MTATLDGVTAATAEVRVAGRRDGSAVLVDDRHLLTAAHVVEPVRFDPAVDLTVGFPGRSGQLAVDTVPLLAGAGDDVAVLRLRDGEEAPVDPVELAPGRRLPGAVKVFGFPHAEKEPTGVWRDFTVSGSTTAATIQLDWIDEGTLHGQSGGPVVGPDARLVGIIVEGAESARFDRFFSLNRVETLWEGLRRPWLFGGQGARAHVRARASGQQGRLRGGDLFRGRDVSLERIRDWLHEDGLGQVLVITGQPGAGKSAVLARAALAAEAEPPEELRGMGLVFHARAAAAADLVDALGDVLGLPENMEEDSLFIELDRLDGSSGRLAVMVDALDEAATLVDSRSMAAILADLAQLSWTRVVVATRPVSDGDRFAYGGLLATLRVSGPSASNLVDLDQPPYLDHDGLFRVASTLLAQDGVARPVAPGAAWTKYREHVDIRERLAAVIADRADRSFLVAALTADLLAQQHEMTDPANPGFDPGQLPSSVGEALTKYLDRLPTRRKVVLQAMLGSLAFARGPGLSDRLWLRVTDGLGYQVGQEDLDELRDSPAIDFLLSSTTDGEERSTRLFHQALVDQFLQHRTRSDHRAVYEALLADVQVSGGWPGSRYGRWYAADHAAAAERLPELLRDLDFLTAAEPRRLATVVRTLEPSTLRAAVLRALEVLRSSTVSDRASYVALAGMIEGEEAWRGADLSSATWTPRWAFWSNRTTGELVANVGSAVRGLSVRERGGHATVIACGGSGAVVAVDPEQEQVQWTVDLGAVITMTALADDGSVLTVCLADGRVLGFDVDRGAEIWHFTHPEPQPTAVAVHAVADGYLVATGTYSEESPAPGDLPLDEKPAVRKGVLRMWEPRHDGSGGPVWVRDVFGSGIQNLEFLPGAVPEQLLAAGDPYGEPRSEQRLVRLLDAGTGEILADLPAESGDVRALATVADGRVYAVTAGSLVRWDLETGEVLRKPSPVDPGPADFVSAGLHRGGAVVVLGAYGELIAVDGATLERLSAPYTAYEPLAALALRDGASDGHPALLVSGDFEGDVRYWSLDRLLRAEPGTLAKIVRVAAHPAAGVAVALVDHPPAALEVRNLGDGRLVRTSDLLPTVIRAVPDRAMVVLGHEGGRIEARRLPDLEKLWSANRHSGDVTDLRLWRDTVVSVGSDHCLRWSDLSDGHELHLPASVPGWEDKGLSEVEVVEGADPDQATVIAGGAAFGLATWRLTARPEAEEFRLQWEHFIQLRSMSYYPGLQRVHWGAVSLLAHVDEPENVILLRSVTDGPRAAQVLSWTPHSHRVTAIAQHGSRLWTADSWGHLATWTAPDTWDANTAPRLLTSIRLGVHIVDILPLGETAAVVATSSGLVTIDTRSGWASPPKRPIPPRNTG